jgi:lambda family phage minor tail protein L
MSPLCLEYDDMVRAKVKIHTTLSKYLDAANWKNGNPGASPADERVQLFYVNAKTAETRVQVDFELCSPFDIQSLQLPTRQITPVCTWCMRGWYRSGTGCDYNGTKYFTKDGTPTDDPSKDVWAAAGRIVRIVTARTRRCRSAVFRLQTCRGNKNA